MKTAIVILNYNSEEDTIRYVKEIENFKCINTIIVVDNLSPKPNTMEKLETLKSEKVHVIRSEKNGGYSYGNNYGLKYLENLNENFDYIVISNPDVSVKENVFDNCFKELNENEKMAVVAPRMLNGEGIAIRRSSWKIRKPGIDMVNSTRLTQILFYPIFRKGEYSEEEFKKDKLKLEAVSGAFFVIRQDVFKKVRIF